MALHRGPASSGLSLAAKAQRQDSRETRTEDPVTELSLAV